jgi:glutathione synthase
MTTILFIMDPLDTLNLETETSLLLMGELMERGHKVLWCEADDLMLEGAMLLAQARQVLNAEPLTTSEPHLINLNDLNGIALRTDPPFNSNYLHLTYLLDHVGEQVTQFNNPAAVRNFNEKLLPLKWPGLAVPSLVTMNPEALSKFLDRHRDIVVKPLDDCSGRGIVRLQSNDTNIESALEDLICSLKENPRFLMAQRFLTDVKQGDKRVFLVDGIIVGAVNRVPRAGTYLANIHQGARCEETQITPEEQSAIEAIAPFLREHGLILAGVDFIGSKITEINITSPSAVRQINQVMGAAIHKKIVGAMLRHMNKKTYPKAAGTKNSAMSDRSTMPNKLSQRPARAI